MSIVPKNSISLLTEAMTPPALRACRRTDFFDGLHCSGTGIVRFFPGVPQALQDLQNGTLPDPLAVHPRTSLEDPAAEGEAAQTTQQEG